MHLSDLAVRSTTQAVRFAFAVLTLWVMVALGEPGTAKRTTSVGRTGKHLPVWVIDAVKELLKEAPSLPNCPDRLRGDPR
jgi:hypothetical protein